MEVRTNEPNELTESAEPSETGQWIPLMDYSIKSGLSLSTLRRYIKARKIHFKTEGGRYLILDESRSSNLIKSNQLTQPNLQLTANDIASAIALDRLKEELKKANEEIAELKTLIAFYEERRPQAQTQDFQGKQKTGLNAHF